MDAQLNYEKAFCLDRWTVTKGNLLVEDTLLEKRWMDGQYLKKYLNYLKTVFLLEHSLLGCQMDGWTVSKDCLLLIEQRLLGCQKGGWTVSKYSLLT